VEGHRHPTVQRRQLAWFKILRWFAPVQEFLVSGLTPLSGVLDFNLVERKSGVVRIVIELQLGLFLVDDFLVKST
jgi:hypothetical protein